jgi:septum formation protein
VQQEKLVLASKSPRRAEILNAVGWPFEAVAPGVDETRHDLEDAPTYVTRLAIEKAQAVGQRFATALVLAADTVVVIDGEILGQPRDESDARRMLGLLSGRWHEVITGVALVRTNTGQLITGREVTRVHFSELSAAEIEWYVASKEPNDKAGAYGIQGRAGIFVEEINGDYFNIMGLPVKLVYRLAREL